MIRKLVFGILLLLAGIHAYGMARNFLSEPVYYVHLTYDIPQSLKSEINLTKIQDSVRSVLAERYPRPRNWFIVEATFIGGRLMLDFSIPDEVSTNLVADEISGRLNSPSVVKAVPVAPAVKVQNIRPLSGDCLTENGGSKGGEGAAPDTMLHGDKIALKTFSHEKKPVYKLMDIFLLFGLLIGVLMWTKPRT